MKKLLFGTIILLFFLACSDDDDNSSNTTLLTKNEWQLVDWTITYTSSGTEYTDDIYNYPDKIGAPECVIDDKLIFEDNNTYQTTPGTIICEPNTSLFGSGEWQFFGDTTISMEPYGNYPAENFKLVNLDDIELRISKIISLTIAKSGELKAAELNALGTTQGIMEYTYYH